MTTESNQQTAPRPAPLVAPQPAPFATPQSAPTLAPRPAPHTDQTWPVLAPAGDQAISVSFENEISEAVHQKVMALQTAIEAKRTADGPLRAVTELIPSYRSLLILFDGLAACFAQIHAELIVLCCALETVALPSARTIEIPTVYGGEFGPDLERVAKHSGLTPEEVIEAHGNKPYLVYMIGFIAGFPYLGGMDQKLATPRLEAPRKKIPAGSVGIAGAQTGVYPLSTPGGWNLIGQTTMPLFDPSAETPVLLRAGDRVVFKPLSQLTPKAPKEDVLSATSQVFDTATSESTTLAIVTEPGMQTTIQDLGRPGYQHLGISGGGAMDRFALKVGNALVGNPLNYPGLEMLMSGLSLQFETDTVIAITGADMEIRLNGEPLPLWQSIKVKKGDQLACGFCTSGARTYLCFGGGVQGDSLFGSYSTALNIGIGGMAGRALKREDILLVLDKNGLEKSKSALERIYPKSKIPAFYTPVAQTLDSNAAPALQTLKVVLGTQVDHFTEQGMQNFLSSAYTMSPASDRMGTRLSGAVIEHSELGADILSDGIAFGAIQVPGDGQPIIMLADRQTIGGYAKIAHVITADHSKLAQLRPGDKIAFTSVSVDTAQELLQLQNKEELEALHLIEELETQQDQGFSLTSKNNVNNDMESNYASLSPRHFNIKINGKKFMVMVEEKVKMR